MGSLLGLHRCYSPAALYPGDEQWGKSDVLDTCDGTHLDVITPIPPLEKKHQQLCSEC